MKIALLSNVNLNSLGVRLNKKYNIYLPDGFNVWVSELMNDTSRFFKSCITDCFIILDSSESAGEGVIESVIESAAKTFEECRFYLAVLNERIMPCLPLKNFLREYPMSVIVNDLCRRLPNVYPFDVESIVRRYGWETVFSPKIWYLSSGPFSITGEKLLMKEIENVLNARYSVKKKCLVLDLDNTLWGGVVGEDSEITLSMYGEGSRFYDFQKRIKEIQSTGVLLAVISKNNEDDALKGFENPGMFLKWSDISAKRINWNDKPTNIAEIADELNIGLDSFVFIDDNPKEREEMRILRPEVTVPDFPEDTCLLSRFAEELYREYFFIHDMTEEDSKKTMMYCENARREEYKSKFTNLDEFLSYMDIKIELRKINDETLNRAVQMTQKTNQFNLTTYRYEIHEMQDLYSRKNYMAYIGKVTDRFGDNGECVLIIGKINENQMEIETFLMSCRVMGRKIEYAALKQFEMDASILGIEVITGKYIPTPKNVPCADFYDKAGYKLCETFTNGEKIYEHILDR